MSEKITILVVVPRFPVCSETFIVRHIEVLLDAGFKVDVLTEKLLPLPEGWILNKDMHDVLSNVILKPTSSRKSAIIRLAGIIVDSLRRPQDLKKMLLYIFKYGRRNWKIAIYIFEQSRRFIGLENYKIYHGHFGETGALLALLRDAGYIKGKVVSTFHGRDAQCYSGKDPLLVAGYLALNYEGTSTAGNNYMAQMIRKRIGIQNNIEVIPMCVDTDFFYQTKRFNIGKVLELISVGRLVEIKGHRYGIELVHMLLKRGNNVHYTIVGGGPLEATLRAHAKFLGIENSVTFRGEASPNIVREELIRANIFLMLSIEDENGCCEAQGVVTAEAQSMNLPVVAFSAGGVPYTLMDDVSGFLVPPRDVAALADAVERLAKNPVLYHSFSQNARQFIEIQYSLAAMKKNFCELYQRLFN